MLPATQIAALILAGGQGQRVGRQNKGLLHLQNKPLIQHLLERLQPQVDTITISANHDLHHYQTYNTLVLTDNPHWQNAGPLAGIASSYNHLPKNLKALLIAPCDTPFLPRNLVQTLTDALFSNTEYQIAYAATPQCIHPSVFLCRPEINTQLPAHINSGQRSLKSWIFKHNATQVLFQDETAFANINTMQTLAHYQ